MNPARAVPCELTNLCMVTDGDRILIEKRNDPDWPVVVFPGGHLEPDESVRDSVIREVREETGLTAESPELVGIQDWSYGKDGRYIVFFYRADRFSGELRASAEGELAWVTADELHAMPLTDLVRRILRVYEDPDVCELYHDKNNWDGRFC